MSVTRIVLSRPGFQATPVSTFAVLPYPGYFLFVARVPRGVVRGAHDVLPEGIEAMKIVLEGFGLGVALVELG